MNIKWSIAIAGAIAVALTGCANSSTGPNNGLHTLNSAYQKPRVPRNNMAHDYNEYTQGIYANHYRYGYTANGFNQDLAEQLTRAADDVPGVDRATVVVSGSDTVIGIRVRENLADQQVKVIEQQVHAAARSVSPNMNIRITSDKAMFDRLLGIRAAVYNEATKRTDDADTVPGKPTTAANDFSVLLQDLGRAVAAPFANPNNK